MRDRWLVNLLLLILVIALVALVRLELAQERRVATLTGLLPGSVREISLERPDRPAIRLVRETDDWTMKAPYEVPADATRIGELVGIAATPVHRSLPKSAGAQGLGLTADSPRLTLNGRVLSFGGTDPITQHRYVAIGEQVHLIGDGFQHHLIASAQDYVDRGVLPAGFRADAGTLDGVPISQRQLTELDGLVAKTVEPQGSELAGRLLSVTSDNGSKSLRFLVSEDGLRWTRFDLRLQYLLAAPPAWAVVDAAPAPNAAKRAAVEVSRRRSRGSVPGSTPCLSCPR
jgi:hypothetical protein